MINNNEILFDELIHKSYGFSALEFYTSPDWRILHKLFNNYHPNGHVENIPKKIHQIWLGGEVPDAYKKYMDSWKINHPTWEYRLWTDKDSKYLKITSRKCFNEASNFAMRSDIMRYEILRQFGGLYVDTDFECLKPFDDLMYLDFFTGISYDTKFVAYNGLIASVPNHPILNDCVHIQTPYTGRRAFKIMESTGAYHFSKCIMRNVNLIDKGFVAFPMDYFYPYPNDKLKENRDPYSFVTENSYAIHHWAVSWIKRRTK